MPLFFVVTIIFYLLANVYVYVRMMQMLVPYSGGIKVVLSLLYWGSALAIFFVFLARGWHLHSGFAHNLAEIGTGWLVFVFYMAALLLLFDILRVFNIQLKLGFLLALFLTLCVLSCGYYHFHSLQKKVINIPGAKLVETYEQPFRIVAVSDLHLGNGMSVERLRENVDAINAQHPDLILIGGDLIDNDVRPLYDMNMAKELDRLHAPKGIYMVPGNHEYISNMREAAEFIEKTPIVLLRDSVVTLSEGIQIVGRDDKMNPRRKSLEELMEKTDSTHFRILLDHQPYNLQETVREGIDLQFSGHTHHGQVWPLSLITDHLFELSYGLRHYGKTTIYVSSGMSLWGPPFRIGTDNEMIVFNLIPSHQ